MKQLQKLRAEIMKISVRIDTSKWNSEKCKIFLLGYQFSKKTNWKKIYEDTVIFHKREIEELKEAIKKLEDKQNG